MRYYDPEILKAVYLLWVNAFNMKKVILKSNVQCMEQIECYELNGEYLRMDSFYENDDLVYCIEWADNIEYAQNNIFEDAYLYYEKDGLDSIINEMKADLMSEIRQ